MILELAGRHGVNTLKAAQAGLLHDCAKSLSGAELKRRLHASGADRWERALPPLWHAPVGALLARTKYRVKDREVLGAIRWHPGGKPGMTILQKCLFVADFIEPGRKFKGLSRLRRLAKADLEAAFVEVMQRKMSYLLEKGRVLHPKGVKAWNELVSKD